MIVVDAGPLWSFAVVGELDILARRLRDRCSWTAAVHAEIRRNADRDQRLAEILQADWLPEPIDLAAAGLEVEAFRVRASMAGPEDHPRQHLGEAESIVWARFIGGMTFLSDDRAACERARFDRLPVLTTLDVLKELHEFGEATSSDLFAIYEGLVDEGRLAPGRTKRDLFG